MFTIEVKEDGKTVDKINDVESYLICTEEVMKDFAKSNIITVGTTHNMIEFCAFLIFKLSKNNREFENFLMGKLREELDLVRDRFGDVETDDLSKDIERFSEALKLLTGDEE